MCSVCIVFSLGIRGECCERSILRSKSEAPIRRPRLLHWMWISYDKLKLSRQKVKKRDPKLATRKAQEEFTDGIVIEYHVPVGLTVQSVATRGKQKAQKRRKCRRKWRDSGCKIIRAIGETSNSPSKNVRETMSSSENAIHKHRAGFERSTCLAYTQKRRCPSRETKDWRGVE